MKKILAMIMAGGKGERLYPLTRDRAKPAVPFGGAYRIIDFTISNCINSEVRKVYILTQYKSLSLDRHIQRAWNILNGRIGDFVYIIHAQQRIDETWYKGTADAIYQNFYTLQQERPDLVLILSGDHIYRMDYRDLINYHVRKKADLTLATMQLPREESRHFGVMEINDDKEIIGFQEKPARPKTIPGKPDSILTNMGVYIFNTDILVKRLIENARKPDTEYDFGKNIIPSMIRRDKVYSYSFIDKSTKKPAYWKDVGTIDAYYEANLDLLNANNSNGLFDPAWPVYTSEKLSSPARVVGYDENNGTSYGRVSNSVIARGCCINTANVHHSILSPNTSVGPLSEITDSVILDDVSIGRSCRLKNCIIDKGVAIPDDTDIGYNLKSDAKNFTVSESGIVVIPKNTVL